MSFKLKAPFKPAGDQPKAIESLVLGLKKELPHQTLLGVTGSGKTFTAANVIASTNKPTLVISHNKVLAAQLWEEFRSFFPENEVHYFVSYYDYYQPEAYIPQTDTYIEKDSSINQELDRMRHAAAQTILTKKDVIVVASVSCIYNLGSPKEYKAVSLDMVSKEIYTVEFDKKNIEKITLTKSGNDNEITKATIFPAKFWVSPASSIDLAFSNIEAELAERLKELKDNGKILEAERLRQRTNFDLAMIKETGYCHGIENYSRHLEFRAEGEAPYTLIDYFNEAYGHGNWLCVIDESHMSIPQIRGMVHGDWARKDMLIEYGFRLPSARDNRPLTFKEFSEKIGPAIFTSATPGQYEFEKSENIIEQIIRPTGLLDPQIEIRPIRGQINDLIKEVAARSKKNERALILTVTKRLAEELSAYLHDKGLKVDWLHSEVKTLERPGRLQNLRSGKVDAVVGINLLREGLDLPEVSLVAILDADKEGFLRNAPTLIQMIGRASRNVNGLVIMYADKITQSMREAINETKRRRKIQEEHNQKMGITPSSILKAINKSRLIPEVRAEEELEKINSSWQGDPKVIELLKKEMKEHSKNMRFEEAARVRDLIKRLTNK
ncbi:MAG: UvrABC system protein B [Parcubacteria group bacterium GW2011_GWA2_40_8]|nr:MAG: UvrABC system protein B [Parcubacteria group bacterium GW2011_GWA2_40_8]